MTAEQKSCFFITPIGVEGSKQRSQSDWIFEYLSPALAEKGYTLTRADKILKPNQITVDIFDRVLNADLCIADLSFLNPNVMYELGVRHMRQKQVILIAHVEWMEKLPFDTQNQRTIGFEIDTPRALKKLASNVIAMAHEIDKEETVSNPLTHAIGSVELQTTGDSRDKFIADLAARLDSLEQKPGENNVSAGIYGQGELATKSLAEVRQLWILDQEANDISWERDENGAITGGYKGFSISLSPQSNGRWSSSARVQEPGVDVPYPRWQASLDDAKAAIVKAINSRVEELNQSSE